MSNTLADYPLHYEDINPTTRKGGKDILKMSSKAKSVEAPAKTYNKTKGEHFKDMVIVALVVGIAAFGLGVKFQADRNTEMQNAVKAAQTATVAAPVAEVKK